MFLDYKFELEEEVYKMRSNGDGSYLFDVVKVIDYNSKYSEYRIDTMEENSVRFNKYYVRFNELVSKKQLDALNLSELEIIMLSKAICILRTNGELNGWRRKEPKWFLKKLYQELVNSYPIFVLSPEQAGFQRKLEITAIKVIYLLKNYIVGLIGSDMAEEEENDLKRMYANMEDILNIDPMG